MNYTVAPVSAVIAARRRWIVTALGAAIVAVALTACGQANDPASVENNGIYVFAGKLTYQLQISRQLNQYSIEDSQYVKGLPPGVSTNIAPNQLWYGVFLWAKNQGSRTYTTTDNFDIQDTEGNIYYPLSLNPVLNPFAWQAQSLAPGATQPTPGTIASFGPAGGGLLLFKLPTTVYDNRPLTLQIKGPSGRVWGTISLDL